MGSSFFWFKNAPTPLFLSKDKTKEQCGKYTTLIPTKTFPKKYGHFSVEFQIALSTYKLDSQNINYIYKIQNTRFFFFFFLQKKPHRTSVCDEASVCVCVCVYIDKYTHIVVVT